MRQILVLAVFLAALPAAARVSSVSPEMDAVLMEGLDDIYRMDFDAADEAVRRAVALDPDYPHAYIGAAANELIRFTYGTEASDTSRLKPFGEKAEKALEVAQRWIKAHPGDPDGLMALGAAHGLAARMAMVRRSWLDSFRHGRKAMKYVRAAIKADPGLHDAYLGVGMFDYYSDTIPRFAGWLAKIMLGGSRERGLRELRATAEKGRYAKTAAQLVLVEVFTEDDYGARNPPEAVRLMREIRAQYPDSPMLHSAFIVALYEDRRHDEALREAQAYLDLTKAGKYPVMNLHKGHALVGTLLWAIGDKEKALDQFRAGAEAQTPGPRSRWAVWSRIRAAQLLDALGRRSEALEVYRRALAEPDLWELGKLVKPCLSRPCVGDRYPGHFSPN